MFSVNRLLEMAKNTADEEKIKRRISHVRMGPWEEDDDKLMVAGDWNTYENDDTMGRLANILSNMDDIHLMWIDEAISCSDCGHYYRSQPTHYGWLPNYLQMDYGIVCNACFEYQPEQYIDYYINNPDNALPNTVRVSPEDLGFEKYNGQFTTGLREGSNDSPEEVLEELNEEGHDVLFYIDSTGQFDTDWSAYIRERD